MGGKKQAFGPVFSLGVLKKKARCDIIRGYILDAREKSKDFRV